MAGSATIGSLRVVLGIDTALFDKGLENARSTLKGVGNSMQSLGKTMSMTLTAPLAAFGALTLNTAGDFEAAMNRVEAAAVGASDETVQNLSDLARELGELGPGAIAGAEGIEALIKNGLDAQKVLDGAGKATVLLAQAAEAQLGPAADVVTDIMAQFGKEASQLIDVVDDVSGTMVASKLDFDGYRLAIGQAGGVAGKFGVTFEDFSATLAAIAPAFASGSDAGTSFKTFLTRLVPQSDGARAAMKELGLEFFDANGKMKAMGDIAQELQEGLAGLSQEARNDALNTIFGSDAIRSAIMLAEVGAPGLAKIREQIDGISASQQAAAKMEGFNGAMKTLSASLIELQIAIGESGLLEFVAGVVVEISKLVKSLAQMNPAFVKWAAIIAGALAVGGPVLIGLGLLATALGAISIPAVLVAGAIVLVTAAVIKFWPEIKRLGEMMGQFLSEEWERFKTAMNNGKEVFNNLTSAIGSFLSDAWAKFENAWDTIVTKVHNVKDELVQFAADIPAMFAQLPAKMLEIGGQIIDGLWNGIKAKWEGLKANVTELGSSMVGWFKNPFDINSPSRVMHEIGVNIMQGLANGLQSLFGSVVGIATSVSEAFVQTAAQAPIAAKQTTDAWAGLRDVKNQADQTGDSLGGMFSGFGSAISDLIKGTKKLKDVLADVLSQLANSTLQSAISAIFSGGGSGGGGFGGFLSSLLGGLIPGFSSGGQCAAGGAVYLPLFRIKVRR